MSKLSDKLLFLCVFVPYFVRATLALFEMCVVKYFNNKKVFFWLVLVILLMSLGYYYHVYSRPSDQKVVDYIYDQFKSGEHYVRIKDSYIDNKWDYICVITPYGGPRSNNNEINKMIRDDISFTLAPHFNYESRVWWIFFVDTKVKNYKKIRVSSKLHLVLSNIGDNCYDVNNAALFLKSDGSYYRVDFGAI
jgi:hypothetical protein